MKKNNFRSVQWWARTAILLALLLVVQMVGFPQPITGPLVNFILLWTVSYNHVYSAILIGSISPWIAYARGILPAPLGPMIPFIILGNVVMVVAFHFLCSFKKGNQYDWIFTASGIVLGAFLKFLILSTAVRLFIEVPPPIAQAMSFPQLLTALGGGALLLVVEPVWKKAFTKRQ